VIVLFGLFVCGLVEITVAVLVASAIGWVWTLLLLVLSSAAGAWLVKREGAATWRRVMDRVAAGQMPADDLLDGFMLVIAGVLALVPGFVSDAIAAALLVPPLRRLARVLVAERLQRRVQHRVARVSTVSFGFGDPNGGFRTYGYGDGSFGSTRGDDDVIDLDSEEIYLDEPVAELEPPRDTGP
jgi:UPF0716 protein FxsA